MMDDLGDAFDWADTAVSAAVSTAASVVSTPAATAAHAASAPAAVNNVAAQNVVAAHPATTEDGVEIIWNGPRVLPSLANATADRAAADSAGLEADQGDVLGDAGSSNTRAATPAASSPPAWLNSAIADAQSVQQATQSGTVAEKVEAQPWMTEAMLDALSKYETLARQRNR